MRLAVAIALLTAVTPPAGARWLDYRTPGIPRTADGKPDLAAPTPRTADGKPDLSGVWMHEVTSPAEMRRLYGPIIDEALKVNGIGMEIGTQHKYSRNILLDVGPDQLLMRPAAVDVQRRRQAESDPAEVCSGVAGFPRAGLLSEPLKIIQAPRETIVMYEVNNLHRQIFTDGRTLPKEFDFPAFLGYSVGRWEGDVFVVETAGFNDRTRLDGVGHPHSESLHVTERFHRTSFGRLEVEFTFDDPVMYTRPFTVKIPHDLLPDADIFEMFCENEKDRVHIQNAGRSGSAR